MLLLLLLLLFLTTAGIQGVSGRFHRHCYSTPRHLSPRGHQQQQAHWLALPQPAAAVAAATISRAHRGGGGSSGSRWFPALESSAREEENEQQHESQDDDSNNTSSIAAGGDAASPLRCDEVWPSATTIATLRVTGGALEEQPSSMAPEEMFDVLTTAEEDIIPDATVLHPTTAAGEKNDGQHSKNHAAFFQKHRSKNSQPAAHGAASTAPTRPVLPKGLLRALGAALLAVFGQRAMYYNSSSNGKLISFGSLYAWALAGSSLGFYLFLYFISLGYALGIFLPVGAALIRYLMRSSASAISVGSVLHATLLLLWGARLLVFLVWREYYSWPALHAKIVQVNRRQQSDDNRSPIVWYQKVLCWLFYSFLYVCMMSPCWFRLESDYAAAAAAAAPPPTTTRRKTGGQIVSTTGILLQMAGLMVESIADWQKSTFKAQKQHRWEWCRTGLWQYSTHPNYAGEWIFWLGTVGAALPAMFRESSPAAVRLVQLVVVLIGFGFISTVLAGATHKLGMKQMQKYGGTDNPEYMQFREETGVFGPRALWKWRRRTEMEEELENTRGIEQVGNGMEEPQVAASEEPALLL